MIIHKRESRAKLLRWRHKRCFARDWKSTLRWDGNADEASKDDAADVSILMD